MNFTLLKRIAAIGCFIFFTLNASAQFTFNCARDTNVAGCPAAACITLKSLIPDPQRAATTYAVNHPSLAPSCLLAANDPALPGQATGLSLDDTYSPVIPIGFPFTFFGTTYNNLKVSSNGYVTFNTALTGFSHYAILRNGTFLTATPGPGVTPEDLPSTLYANSIIMGPYHDIDVGVTATPPGRIEYIGVGVSPYRKWTINFYRIPLFLGSCNPLRENTHSITLYESTGIIEVNIYDKQICTGWNDGRAMVGVQNATQNVGVMAPGRRASDPQWGGIGMNEQWRFVPIGGTPLFKRVELYDLSNTLVATGTTVALPSGDRDVSFANVCAPAGASTTYIIKAFYEKIDDATQEVYGVDTIRVNRTQGLASIATPTAASCGLNNGSITVTPNGGVGPYQYSLDGVTWQSSNVFSGLASGTYTVYVKDSGPTCTSNNTVTVPVTSNLLATTSITNAACTGQNNGTITVSAVGGTGPYTFSIDGGPAVAGTLPFTFTNLSPGNHTVVVTQPSDGCSTGSLVIPVSAGPGVATTSAQTSATCAGVANGQLTVTATTGTGPFTWVIDGGAPVSGPSPHVFTGLLSGSHTVVVTDAVGCSRTFTASVLAGSGVTATTATTPATCTGAPTGSITVTTTAGTAPFTFVLDGGSPVTGPSPQTFSGLLPGTHSVVITDANGCTRTINVNVAAGTGITASATQTAASCPSAANGSITVNATVGTAPFTYALDGGAPQSGANPYTFAGVTPGAHTVLVTDAAGCTRTVNITVLAGPGISANAVPAATSCNGAADGTITITPTSGTAPYTFTLDGGVPVSGAAPYTFNALAAGAHTIVVTDANGCATNLINVTISTGPAMTGTVTTNATTCSGAGNGSITVNPTVGTGPYTFSLDGGAPVAGAIPYTFTNVPAGPHTVVITNAAGCTSTALNADVVAGPNLTTTVSKTDVLCNAGATGTITVATPTIGTAPYEYSLDGTTWQFSNVFNGLVAGIYTVYYREANGCQGSQVITVAEPPVLAAVATVTDVVCNGQANGIINVAPGGGVGPYEYSIDGGTTWQPSNIFNVPAGTYTVIVRDLNQCTVSRVITVNEPIALSAISANTNASCDGGNDGVIDVTASGGNNGYQYSIDNGTTWQSSNIFNVAPGNYTILVKDALGCTTSFNTTVGLSNNLSFTAQTDPTICESKSVQLDLVSNATVYSWTPSVALSNPNIHNPVANPTVTTQYIVTATLGRCSANDTVIVNVNPAPIPDAGVDGFICYGQTYNLNASGGTVYSWSPSTYLNNPNIPNPVSTPAKDITYTLTILSDANGCASLVTDNISIDVTPPVKVKTFPYDTIAYPGDRFQLLAVPSDPDATNFTWSPATGLSNTNTANPVVTVGPIGSDITYQVVASTVAGCKGEGYVHIKVYTGPDIYVPTGFTPNGDGRNDRFTPFPVGIKSMNYFRVYNRWGQLVFSTNALYVGWDGTLGGALQPSGTYVWMAEGVTLQGKLITKKGTVTLIR